MKLAVTVRIINFFQNKLKAMTEREKILAAHFLRKASTVFSYHICNDVEKEVWQDWTEKQRKSFIKKYCEFYAEDEKTVTDISTLPDDLIMGFLSYRLDPHPSNFI